MSTRAGRAAKTREEIAGQLDTLGLLREANVITPVSMDLPAIFKGRDLQDDASLELWGQIGGFIGLLTRSTVWWVADWLNFGEERFNESERYAQVIEATGLSLGRLGNIARVGRAIAPSRRLGLVRGEPVPFSLHEEVYTLTPTDQTRWLKHATGTDPFMTQKELRDAIKAEANGGVVPLPGTEDDDNDDPKISTSRVVEVARLLYAQARVNGNEVTLPLETYRQLAAALGKGE